ncbi:PKD domain-containing protein [Methanosarcina sp. DH2]|uniref:NosD domain-containing protein n=1 Tax=Methanosarcina sp. DH2 TaxID=2605639 RepID=UPI001E37D034|nr:NosD domain-containing protein [Methanosarcina sp. DH2]MCC4769518.1 PKD domain-containing protein [Methanosarcina sp. DH2]
MRNRTIFSIILVFIFIISVSATSSAREITVDDGSGADFRSIQEAVNNSVTGDIIVVMPGIYTENVRVDVKGLTIRSESNNGDAQVKPLNESKSTFLITANSTTISGLNITGAGKMHHKNAIFAYGKMNNVTGNNIENGSIFLGSYMPDNLKIIFHGDMNNVTGNNIENGSIILGSEISGNLIAENKISNGEGIHISCCGRNNTVLGNTISNCSTGIYAYDQAVEIRNNRIANCNYGIRLSFVSSGIDNNTILNCDVGIHLGDGCLGAEIINNTIMSSAECGIVDQYNEGGKRIYNNYFNNTVNVRFGAGRENTWNNSLTRGTNIAGSPYIGGNFWAKPDGTGFSQICVDLDRNGIGDLPYKIYEDPYNVYEDEFDYLPLVSMSSLQNSVTPTANFTASVTNGPAPLVVKFTDLSKNAVVWNWDFDGDGISDSKKQNPVYAYKTSGNYTVNLTASNGINTSSKLVNITVGKRVSSTWPFVYITNNGAFSVIDTATGIVITSVKVGSGSKGVAVVPNGKTAYVTNYQDGNVSVIDTSTNTVTDTVKVGDNPSEVAVSPDGKKVYVVNENSNTTSVIDTATNTVTATVPVGSGPKGVAFTPDGKKVYVTNYGSFFSPSNTTVSVIDTATNAVTATVPVGIWSCGVAVAPDGKTAYVAKIYDNTVSVIDTATNAVIATVDVDNSPHEVVVNPTGTKVYVAGGNGFVSVIDTSTRKVVTTMNVEGSPEEIAITPNGKKVYVVTKGDYGNNYSNNISIIDTSSDTISATVNIEISPGGLAIIPDPESVLPVASFSGNVSGGFTPLSVQFTDSSENATEWNWDFGDGAASNEHNPAHTYLSPGNYTACLIVNNPDGTDSRFTTITVLESSSGVDNDSSGGSSHGSGG